jgi:hypothetical protein
MHTIGVKALHLKCLATYICIYITEFKYGHVLSFRDSKIIVDSEFDRDLFIVIFTVITAVVHFTNAQHINQRLVFWYHFTCDCPGPLLSGVFLALVSLL